MVAKKNEGELFCGDKDIPWGKSLRWYVHMVCSHFLKNCMYTQRRSEKSLRDLLTVAISKSKLRDF